MEVEVECECPECGHTFTKTVEVEAEERDEA